MFRMTHYFKIFWSIVRIVMVDVMDYFASFKDSSKFLRCYISMFKDSSMLICHRMTMNPKSDIPFFIAHSKPSYPMVVGFSLRPIWGIFPKAWSRTEVSLLKLARSFQEGFIAC